AVLDGSGFEMYLHFLREHWKLLFSLKTTVEGLVSTNNPNVWSRYGGLQRLHKDMNNILSHGLRNEQVRRHSRDYWPFVWCVRYISPHLASHVEQFSRLEPVLSSGMQSTGESYKAERWLLHSLQVHMLSSQLRPLLRHLGHTRKYYNDDAFLLSEPHVTAMFQCLEAVEQNNPKLLAQVDTVGVSVSHIINRTSVHRLNPVRTPAHVGHSASAHHTVSVCVADALCSGSSVGPWMCVSGPGSSDLLAVPCGGPGSVPSISLTESPSSSSLQPEAVDSADADYDDGPEYLAIGNLGQRSRQDSRSSIHSSEQEDSREHSLKPPLLAPPPPRRSSFSEGQRAPGRGSRGHTRSFSDTGINQKLRNGKYGSQYNGVPDGMFRKPSEGQSLISYLSEQDFGSCADLEKENAHFSISESLIAAIELMKYNLRRQEEEGEEEGDSDCEIQQLKQKIRLRRQQIRRSRLLTCSASQHMFQSTDSGGSRRSSQGSDQGLSDSGSAEEVDECELRGTVRVTDNQTLKSPCCSCDMFSPSFLQSNSAESVAMGLLRQFEGMQLPAASELDWLVPEHDAPQKLLPIPDSLPISPDDGNLEWAPPRPQIIFTSTLPPSERKVVVAKQNYRCAGCGTRIDPDYIKRLRYCEYLGRGGSRRVLRKWDFSKYYVSNFARDLLSKIAWRPSLCVPSCFLTSDAHLMLVDLNRACVCVLLYVFRVLDQLDSLPGHLTEDPALFSLNDLSAVRNGELAPRMRELLKTGTMHVAGCVLCQAKGFVCEFCGNDKDIIFPFQLNKCQRCEECHAGYHRGCFSAGRDCPRCRRLAERRERMARKNMEEQEDEGGGAGLTAGRMEA
uniref:Rubicon autophagy regulator n=1 Tax=Sphaeramia orbicularis TaxID=375764 RepID=A0A672YIT3_9TELE